MSWIKFRLGRGTLKIKPRSQMRSYEAEGVVPSLNLGLFIISWWSDAAQQRVDGGHWAYRLPDAEAAASFTPPAATKPRADEAEINLPPS